MSLDFASLVSGPSAPDLAILALFSSWVAKFVMQPTALHCTSTFGDIICLMRGERPPSSTIETLFSAAEQTSAVSSHIIRSRDRPFTARLPNAALAARCTSTSGLWRRNRIGSRVSRPTSLTSARKISDDHSDVGSRGKTSLSDLCKGKTGTPLKVDIFGIHQGTQGLKWLP